MSFIPFACPERPFHYYMLCDTSLSASMIWTPESFEMYFVLSVRVDFVK